MLHSRLVINLPSVHLRESRFLILRLWKRIWEEFVGYFFLRLLDRVDFKLEETERFARYSLEDVTFVYF